MEDLETHLQRQLHWISAADGKATPIFAIDTAMLAVLAALVHDKTSWTIFPAIVGTLAALLLVGSVGALAVAAFPRTTGPKGSLLFFGGICEYDEQNFLTQINQAQPLDLRRDYARQIYRNAQIANIKYWWVKAAMIAMFASVIPWLIAIYLLY